MSAVASAQKSTHAVPSSNEHSPSIRVVTVSSRCFRMKNQSLHRRCPIDARVVITVGWSPDPTLKEGVGTESQPATARTLRAGIAIGGTAGSNHTGLQDAPGLCPGLAQRWPVRADRSQPVLPSGNNKSAVSGSAKTGVASDRTAGNDPASFVLTWHEGQFAGRRTCCHGAFRLT